MVKNVVYSFMKMNKDIAEAKNPSNFFYDGHNLRFITNNDITTGGFSFEKGNSLVVEIPTITINPTTHSIDYTNSNGAQQLIYEIDTTIIQPRSEIEESYYISLNNYKASAKQHIIGFSTTRDYIILFTTDNNGFDCIWKVNDEDYALELIYLRDLDFSIDYPIQSLNNFENISIDKVYWVTGKDQVRFINISHSIANGDLEELIDLPSNVINMVSKYNLTQPIVTNLVSGGTHTAGVIQYAYNLYKLNSSQTKLSPISPLISLDKQTLGGGDVNESVGLIPIVSIDNIDSDYTNIRVYAIKYTTYGGVPTISLIEDREIPSNRNIDVFDDGSVISSLSLEEFLFLGSDIIIPRHIEAKNNRMFIANYKEINFEVNLDMRAYSFDATQSSIVYDSIFLDVGNIINGTPRNITSSFTDDPLDTFDSININYNNYKYQRDGITIGGEGKYIKYELTQSTVFNSDAKYFKDEEIYRIGIEFFNSYGQNSLPIWIADFKTQKGNLSGLYNTLQVELKGDFFIWLNTFNFANDYDKPLGFRILTAERTNNDRTIIASGLVSTMMTNDKSKKNVGDTDPDDIAYITQKSDENPKLPNILVRNINENTLYGSTQPLRKAIHNAQMNINRESPNTEAQRAYYGGSDTSGRLYQYNAMEQLYCPEILFGESISLSAGLKARIKGVYKNTYNANWGKSIKPSDGTINDEGKAYNGIVPAYSSTVKDIVGSAYRPWDHGIIGHPGGSNSDKVLHGQIYRGYGDITITDNFVVNTNIVRIENDLVLTGVYTDPLGNISQIDNNRGIKFITKKCTYDVAHIKYEIFPDASHMSTQYTVRIATDNEGANVVAQFLNVTGNQTITANNTNAGFNCDFEQVFNYYLIIESSNVNFFGTTDATAWLDSTDIEKESLGNNFGLNTPTTVLTSFIPAPITVSYDIYGKPELTERGQSFTTYNNDAKYRYANTLQSVLVDGDTSWDDNGTYSRQIVSINSDGQKCITMVLGPNTTAIDSFDRPLIGTDMLNDAGLHGEDNLLIMELVKSDNDIYLGNIYGGNSFEDKRRTNYIEIGDYKNIDSTSPVLSIESPGDTFVNYFRFERIMKRDEIIISEGYPQYTEIVEYKTETTIDLKNRNDLSLNDWDSKFHPSNQDYHKYNRVYSQASDLIIRKGINYNVKKISNFDTNIITTKLKSPGELIDSWTDILQNEVMTLDGKYGPINGLPSAGDNIFAFQDRAIAFISIDPRVQVQGNDGINIELGFGSVLQEYKYISTNTGSVNKWGILPTETGIYYLDIINKTFNVVEGNTVVGLSDREGFHNYFLNEINFNVLRTDNPVKHNGVSIGWDKITNDIYLTMFKGDDETITLSYNIAQKGFSSFYDYHSSMYIFTKGKLHTINPNDDSQIYLNFEGDYNIFYEENKKSTISWIVNPEPQVECTVNNLEYKSEAINVFNNNTEVNYTWDRIQAYNEFQDSGLINLVSRINIRKENRKWRLNVPRDQNKTQRIRNTWSILKLEADNPDNLKYRNNDIIVYYNPNYKIIE